MFGFTVKRFLQSLNAALKLTPGCETLLVAYSGGIDSHVLLHACSELQEKQPSLNVEAVYIDHGLHQDSDKWRLHCNAVSQQLSIRFNSIKVDARDVNNDGPEQAARKARYGAFEKLVKQGVVLFTAQHQDDQAETLMLQLLRGCGIDGLAAMPKVDTFSKGHLVRPFLELDKASIIAYAEHYNLSWIEDPSNKELNYNRNYLRHNVIPTIKERWPAFARTTARTASHCAESSDVLDNYLAQYINAQEPRILDISSLVLKDGAEQRAIYRYWLKCNDVTMPSSKILNEIVEGVVNAIDDKSPILQWNDVEVRRHQQCLYLLNKLSAIPAGDIIDWKGDKCSLPHSLGDLMLMPTDGEGISKDIWTSSLITIKFRQGGEKLKIEGREGTKQVKKLLNERAVPVWIRQRVPLVYINGELAAVAGYWINASFIAKPNQQGYQIKWQQPDFLIN